MSMLIRTCLIKLWIAFLLIGINIFIAQSISYAETTVTHKIGENFGGGIVFYIDDSGEHGLIAAKENIYGTYLVGVLPGVGKCYSEGLTWKDAWLACKNLNIDGYCDWFMPDKEQLN